MNRPIKSEVFDIIILLILVCVLVLSFIGSGC